MIIATKLFLFINLQKVAISQSDSWETNQQQQLSDYNQASSYSSDIKQMRGLVGSVIHHRDPQWTTKYKDATTQMYWWQLNN